MTRPKLKICGMRDPVNYAQVEALGPDYLGLIFYPGSPRYAGGVSSHEIARATKKSQRVGVFVNSKAADMLTVAKKWDLDLIQLHGQETVSRCKEIKMAGYDVIKVFHMHPDFDFNSVKPYAPVVDYFLFDTRSTVKGGSGRTFDWSLLDHYELNVPFFLSGGVGLEQLDHLRRLNYAQLFALDVNSKFETSPGVKDKERLKKLVKLLDDWEK